jgi:hypothetical protein
MGGGVGWCGVCINFLKFNHLDPRVLDSYSRNPQNRYNYPTFIWNIHLWNFVNFRRSLWKILAGCFSEILICHYLYCCSFSDLHCNLISSRIINKKLASPKFCRGVYTLLLILTTWVWSWTICICALRKSYTLISYEKCSK